MYTVNYSTHALLFFTACYRAFIIIKMKTNIIKLLAFLKVVKVDGFTTGGTPMTVGANKCNPLSYIIGFPLILLIAITYFFKGIKEGWHAIF